MILISQDKTKSVFKALRFASKLEISVGRQYCNLFVSVFYGLSSIVRYILIMIIESGLLSNNMRVLSRLNDFRLLNGYTHLANNPRWPLFVESIYGHRAYYIEVKTSGDALAYAVGNLCRISTSGRNILVLGAFLDYGVEMYLRDIESQSVEKIQREILLQTHFNGILTKRKTPLKELSRHSQAIIDFSEHTIDSLEKNITSRARNDLRQFEIYGNSIVVDNGHLPEFYKLYVKRMKEFGTPAHPIKFFNRLLKTFDSRIVIAYNQNGNPSAASFSICEDDTWLHLYAVGDRTLRKGNPGDRVLWEEMKMAIERGVQSFWLGRSVHNSDIEKYKEKWNPHFYSTTETIGTRNNLELGFQEINQEGSKSIFANIWRRLPVIGTNCINSSIRRYIP